MYPKKVKESKQSYFDLFIDFKDFLVDSAKTHGYDISRQTHGVLKYRLCFSWQTCLNSVIIFRRKDKRS